MNRGTKLSRKSILLIILSIHHKNTFFVSIYWRSLSTCVFGWWQGSSRSYTHIPDERRIAIAQKLKEDEIWSSDEEDEPKIIVAKSKKTQVIVQKNIPGGTSNSVEESKRELQKLETKMDELFTLVQSMSERNKQVEHVLCQVAEKANISHNLRGS